jgi:ABC-2 type transport system permease protein
MRSLLNIMRKELTQTVRDRRMVFMLILAPVIQLVAFGYAVNMDVDRIPTVVCDQDDTPESRRLLQQFFGDRTFRRRSDVRDPEWAQAAIESGVASVAVIVPRGFAQRRARGDVVQVQVLLDGTDSTRATVAANDANQFLALAGVGVTTTTPGAATGTSLLAPRILYNQRMSTPVYMVPGIAATLLLNVTAIITAMGLAREKETGTLEQILVTPIRPTALLAGKCLPYILFGLIDIAAVLLVGSFLFEVPIRGSLAVIAVGSFLYLFSTLGVGILLATFSGSQQQAILGAFSFMLPTMMLSGFMSPIGSMPAWLRPLTMLIPMRHFIEIVRGCLLKGSGIGDLLPQFVSLIVLGVGILGVSVGRFHKRLA